MNAKELIALKPIGRTVRFSDGLPCPPARLKRKVRGWLKNNGSGKFIEAKVRSGPEVWRCGTFTLEIKRGPGLVVNYVFHEDSELTFTLEEP